MVSKNMKVGGDMERGGLDQKGGPGNECARRSCTNSPAIGYNRSTGMWYCKNCTNILNEENEKDAMELYGGPLVIIPDIEEIV